ncbi:unnamed protein product [Musa hybrid cultivar]
MYDIIKINWIIVLSWYSGTSTYLYSNSKPNLKSDLLQYFSTHSAARSTFRGQHRRHNRALPHKPNRNMHGEVHVLHPATCIPSAVHVNIQRVTV